MLSTMDPDEPDQVVEASVTREDDKSIGLHYTRETGNGPHGLDETHIWVPQPDSPGPEPD